MVRTGEPLKKVVRSVLLWEGNPHQVGNRYGNRTFLRDTLECGHTVEVRPRKAKSRRCDGCKLEKKKKDKR